MKSLNIFLRIIITIGLSLGSIAYADFLLVKEREPIKLLFLEIPHEYLLVMLLVLNILCVAYIFTDTLDKIITKYGTYLLALFCTLAVYSVCMSIFIMMIDKYNVQTSILGMLIIIGMNIIISAIILRIYFCIKENKRKVFENHLAFVHYILIYCSTILSGMSLLSQEVSNVWNPYIFLLVLAVLNNYVCKAVITKTTWA